MKARGTIIVRRILEMHICVNKAAAPGTGMNPLRISEWNCSGTKARRPERLGVQHGNQEDQTKKPASKCRFGNVWKGSCSPTFGIVLKVDSGGAVWQREVLATTLNLTSKLHAVELSAHCQRKMAFSCVFMRGNGSTCLAVMKRVHLAMSPYRSAGPFAEIDFDDR